MDPSMHPARLRIGIIGAGRVGSVLGAALHRAGHQITGVYAVSQASRDRAADLLPGIPIVDLPAAVAGQDLVLLAVPDDSLGELVRGLGAAGAWEAGQLVVHTSGRHGIGVLQPVLASHSLPLALHPAMTFTGTAMDLDRLADCAFGVTAPAGLRELAMALVLDMGGAPVWIEEADRLGYHAALAHGANHLVTLIAQAMDVLRSAGVDGPAEVLGPLVRAALDNALRVGDKALTGPVARADVSTVRSHLSALEQVSPETRRTYVALARATTVRALASGRLQPSQGDALLDTLAEERP